ncbi:MAG: orotidine-5'-phosphate decarboxylase [Patescibacteria group bacterium]|nr:orotidine-5'-phosphate decarboxylase [Patescibacteria group bacterium]
MKISDSHWLTPLEQDEVCTELLRFDLIKWDNKRQLPLKSGGKTDVYINLREARSNPEALLWLSNVYSNPLRRLKPDRFVEVPDSVSCLAGVLAVQTGIPYITIREEAKQGRVAKAKVIGEANYNDLVCVIDDVITTGGSASMPYEECLASGLEILPMVVLVDRQEGWKKTFAAKNIPMEVWSGMTLHDVRKYLITHNIMQRCDPALEEKNPLIIALDGMDWETALSIMDPLRTSGCIFKVNNLLLNTGIASLIPNLQVYGRVMADLKIHDIKNTADNIVKDLQENPPWAVTVHGTGGDEMIKTVVDGLKDTPTKVLVVTVLTSIDEKTGIEIYNRLPREEVKILAAIAKRAGAHGLVCSPEEVKELREIYSDMTLVTPGIRSSEVGKDDQKRTGTPAQTIADGSNHLVMGRQITQAKDPVAEVKRLLTEELQITI